MAAEVAMQHNLLLAVVLTLLAGLSTGIGSAVAYFIRKPKLVFLSFGLGFSTGVMVYVAFMELLPQGMLVAGKWTGALAFFCGLIFVFVIDRLVPEVENPHEYREYGDIAVAEPGRPNPHLMRAGIFTAAAISIHNFPEGLATFMSVLTDLKVGIFIAIAIAIHNIPEGISVSMPIYYATGDKRKAFIWSALSGSVEPIGGLLGYLVLWPFLSARVVAMLMAAIGGIMVYVSLDELLPMAHRTGRGHVVILGIMVGMAVMAGSLLLL